MKWKWLSIHLSHFLFSNFYIVLKQNKKLKILPLLLFPLFHQTCWKRRKAPRRFISWLIDYLQLIFLLVKQIILTAFKNILPFFFKHSAFAFLLFPSNTGKSKSNSQVGKILSVYSNSLPFLWGMFVVGVAKWSSKMTWAGLHKWIEKKYIHGNYYSNLSLSSLFIYGFPHHFHSHFLCFCAHMNRTGNPTISLVWRDWICSCSLDWVTTITPPSKCCCNANVNVNCSWCYTNLPQACICWLLSRSTESCFVLF